MRPPRPDALMLVAPSDHVIDDAGAFSAALETGAEAARAGRLVTFGIARRRPVIRVMVITSRPERSS